MRFSKHKSIREEGYKKFDNYDILNVDFTDAIPDDYDGVMGVPISFMDRYCPEQFEIIGGYDTLINGMIKSNEGKINGRITYARILIRHIRK